MIKEIWGIIMQTPVKTRLLFIALVAGSFALWAALAYLAVRLVQLYCEAL